MAVAALLHHVVDAGRVSQLSEGARDGRMHAADGRKPLRQPALECIEPALERPRLTELVAHGPALAPQRSSSAVWASDSSSA